MRKGEKEERSLARSGCDDRFFQTAPLDAPFPPASGHAQSLLSASQRRDRNISSDSASRKEKEGRFPLSRARSRFCQDHLVEFFSLLSSFARSRAEKQQAGLLFQPRPLLFSSLSLSLSSLSIFSFSPSSLVARFPPPPLSLFPGGKKKKKRTKSRKTKPKKSKKDMFF